MEKHVNEQIKTYVHDFKKQLFHMIGEYKIESEMPHSNTGACDNNNNVNIHQVINFINDFPVLQLEKEDFLKRKRTKNIVPYYDRCMAKRATGEQCTRRKKKDETLCGTHLKGTPHGEISNANTVTDKSVHVFAYDIKGIHYYLDQHENVYNTEDVQNGIKNPRVIAKYEVIDGKYNIPSFNLYS